MKLILVLSILLYSTAAFSAGGGEGIPWSMITAQTVNVILAIGILTWLLKDKIKALFVGRVDKFDEEFRKAQEQKELAIKNRDEIKERLEQLKVNADKSISEAKVNAKNNSETLINNANEQAKKIIIDSESKIMNEKNKIVSELKMDLLSKSFKKAKVGLSEGMSQPDLQKLKDEFIRNIEAVQ